MATEPRSTTAPGVDGELMPQRSVLEDEIAAGADRSEECCDKQTEVEHRRASRGSPILCYLRTELHLSGFAVPRSTHAVVVEFGLASIQSHEARQLPDRVVAILLVVKPEAEGLHAHATHTDRTAAHGAQVTRNNHGHSIGPAPKGVGADDTAVSWRRPSRLRAPVG